MKTRLITVGFFSVLVCGQVSAQLKVHSNGNVGIQSSVVPECALLIGGDDATIDTGNWKTVIRSENEGLFIVRKGSTTISGTAELFPIWGQNTIDGDKFYFGMKGSSWSETPQNQGRAWGVLGEAGNSTSGWNFAVHGNLRGNQNGAAILGTFNSAGLNIPGRYTGYFTGDVRVTGNLYGTLLTPSASSSSLMKHTVVMPLSVEADGSENLSVSEKLSQLTAIQYNLAEPQTAQTYAAGDTIAAASYFVTDVQALAKTHYGLDAEALQEVFPDLVYESQEGEPYINYTEMIPLLVQAISELKAEVIALQAEKVHLLQAKEMEGSRNGLFLTTPELEQNDPSPFTQTTVINYTLPESVGTAYLYIYDLNGTQLDCKSLVGRGRSSINLEAGSLAAGIYLYALVADGKVIDTKRMMITH